MFYAHTRKGEKKEMWQLLEDHLTQTGNLAGSFAEKFNAKQLGYTVGVLHDLGKYSIEFQKRLEGANIRVDHSTAGMQEVFKLYDKFSAKIMSYIICGHHTGLPDIGSENYEGSLENRRIRSIHDYRAYKKEINPPDLAEFRLNLKHSEDMAFSVYLFIKMLFSCLVDADFLDTEKYMEEQKANSRGNNVSMVELLTFFEKYMEEKIADAEDNIINSYRSEILNNCLNKAQNMPGMFSLTVPTGGGKTLSSMAFALNHAVKNGLERIIYVIPYTSIIEQNAEIFRNIFGEANVLEHHSNFQFEEDEDIHESSKKLRLASENWEMPIVVTTNVQFFESIFSNKGSKSRKLHNLTKSIIILDEAQMIPVKYLKASIFALCEFVNNYNSSVVLCTATQPNLTCLLPKEMNIQEIMDSPESLYEKLRRTQIKNIGELDDEDLIEELRKHPQILCIVNTREHARQLYEKLTENIDDSLNNSDGIFHLSTRMYPLHRKQVLAKIRQRLKDSKNREDKLECKVISTQLIEAGVDVDFPVVYRTMAGIDSIAQAAGRCNREGKEKCADVYVFTSTEKHGQPPRQIEINVSEAKSVFRNYEDALSLAGISKYFELLYDIKNVDQKDILKDIKERSKSLGFPFVEIARKFKLIENNTLSVIVPADDRCKDLIKQLKYAPSTYKLLRKLQPYIVNLYENEFRKLMETGGISAIDSEKTFYAISDMKKFYNEHTGIVNNRDDLLYDVLMC
ncbi:MAG: CRISPR-associated helicase Cas3' [Halanaerobiales bacterium]|nr:CRISPR-associated helicase Cas3' [Halanaerobiales bacterium]